MNVMTIAIGRKHYTIDLATKSVWEYTLSKGGDEFGDIEGYEDVGTIISIDNKIVSFDKEAI